MGKGIDNARALPGSMAHAAVLDDLKDQLLIVLMKRLQDDEGRVVLPIKEIDDTGRDTLSFQILGMGTSNSRLEFQLGRKN